MKPIKMVSMVISISLTFLILMTMLRSTDWYAERKAEEIRLAEKELLIDIKKAYNKALEKKSNAQVCIKTNSRDKMYYIEISNKYITEYNNMLENLPLEKRKDLKPIEYNELE